MPTNYQYRYVTLIKEDSYATVGSGLSLTGEVDDESVAHQFDLMTRGDMSYLGAKKSVVGKTHSEGGINLVCQPDDFSAMLLRGVYNSYQLNSGTSHYMHETMGIATGLPSFTLKIGREDAEHTYAGMCLTRVSMAANVGEYVTMSADFTGRGETPVVGVLSTAPTFSGGEDDGFHFVGAEVFFDDGTVAKPVSAGADVKSFSLEWNTNLNTDTSYALGSRTCAKQPAPQMREITGSLEFSRPVLAVAPALGPNDEPAYQAAQTAAGLIYDSAITTLLDGAVTAGATSITVDATANFISTGGTATIGNDTFIYTSATGTTISGIPASGDGAIAAHADNSVVTAGRPAIQLKLTSGAKIVTIDVQKVIWDSPTMNVSGRDASSMSLGFTALVDVGHRMSTVTWANQSTVSLA